MTGSVQHLGGDRYRVRVYAGNGRYRSRSFRATSERAAKKQATAHAAALLADIATTRHAPGTVAELAAEFIALKRQQGRAPTTLDGYETITRRIVDRFGKLRVDELNGRLIDRWYGELMTSGMTPNTLQHHHAVLRAMLRQAERWDQVTRIATRQASPPSTTRPELVIPTDDVMRLLIGSATGHFQRALRVLAGTGMRRGELCGLAFSDLDGRMLTIRRAVSEPTSGRKERGPARLHVGPTKGKRSRTLEVGADVVRAFAEQRDDLGELSVMMGVALVADGPVFADVKADPTGRRPRAPSWVSHQWDRLVARHGVDFRVHDVRHWHATTLLNRGVPIHEVSARLGHAKVSTTLDIYAHAMRGAGTQVVSVIDGALGLPSGA